MRLSVRHFKPLIRISKRDEQTIIKEMKQRIKSDTTVIEKFEEYGVPIDKIDDVHVEFAELDVSAKTKNKKIYLNKNMLDDDSEVKDPTMYLAHELVHFCQQFTGKNLDKHNEEDEYLEKETEIEAFQVQEDFIEETQGTPAAEGYISDLLDFHEYTGKKRKDKEEELMDE